MSASLCNRVLSCIAGRARLIAHKVRGARCRNCGSVMSVNGQVAVPGGGQVKVPIPRADHFLFRVVPPLARAWRMRYESPPCPRRDPRRRRQPHPRRLPRPRRTAEPDHQRAAPTRRRQHRSSAPRQPPRPLPAAPAAARTDQPPLIRPGNQHHSETPPQPKRDQTPNSFGTSSNHQSPTSQGTKSLSAQPKIIRPCRRTG